MKHEVFLSPSFIPCDNLLTYYRESRYAGRRPEPKFCRLGLLSLVELSYWAGAQPTSPTSPTMHPVPFLTAKSMTSQAPLCPPLPAVPKMSFAGRRVSVLTAPGPSRSQDASRRFSTSKEPSSQGDPTCHWRGNLKAPLQSNGWLMCLHHRTVFSCARQVPRPRSSQTPCRTRLEPCQYRCDLVLAPSRVGYGQC